MHACLTVTATLRSQEDVRCDGGFSEGDDDVMMCNGREMDGGDERALLETACMYAGRQYLSEDTIAEMRLNDY